MSDDRFPWLVEGAEVRIVGGRRLGDIGKPAHATPAVVRRITMRDVVVKERRSEGAPARPERRFRRSDLTEYGQHDSWSAPTRLYPPDDPVVVEVREFREEQTLRARISNYYSAWTKAEITEDAVDMAETTITLLQEWLDNKREQV